jgi:hypothetical protein
MVRAFSTRKTARFRRSNRMDIVYIGLTVGFFVVSWAFIVACERLS